MYAPQQFREERRDVLVAAMRDIQFSAIVTSGDDGLHVTHAPTVIREQGEALLVEFHVARANPHWQLAGAQTVAIFQGPQAYIHPGWYESKAEHGRVVPTWTYVSVHAHGLLEVMGTEDQLRAHLNELTGQNEAPREKPWAVSDAPDKYISGMTRAIVGLRLKVERLEGSWKLNQHKSDGDRRGVQSGLAAETNAESQSIAALMQSLDVARAAAVNDKQKAEPT